MPCPPLSQEAARAQQEKAELEAARVREDALADLLQPKEGLAFMEDHSKTLKEYYYAQKTEGSSRIRGLLDPPLGQMFDFDFPPGDFGGDTDAKDASQNTATVEEMPAHANALLAKMESVLASTAETRNRLQEIYQAPFAVRGFRGTIEKSNEFVMYIVEDQNNSAFLLCFDTPPNFKKWLKYRCAERLAHRKACQDAPDKAVLSARAKEAAYIPQIPDTSDVVDGFLELGLMNPPLLPGFDAHELPGMDLAGVRPELTRLVAAVDCDIEDIAGPTDSFEDQHASLNVNGTMATEVATALRHETLHGKSRRDVEWLVDWLQQALLGKDSVHAAINQLTDEQIVRSIQENEAFFKSRRSSEILESTAHLVAPLSLGSWTQGPFEELAIGDRRYVRLVLSRQRKSICGCIPMGVQALPLYFYINQRPAVERLFNFDAVGRSYYSEVPPAPRKTPEYEAEVGGEDEIPPMAPQASAVTGMPRQVNFPDKGVLMMCVDL